MFTNSITFEIENARASFHDGFEYPDCSAVVDISRDLDRGGTIAAKTIDGTLTFPDEPPEYLFVDDEKLPRMHDIVLENDDKRLTIEGILITTAINGPSVDFVAMDATKTEYNDNDDHREVVAITIDGESIEVTDIDYDTNIEEVRPGKLVADINLRSAEFTGTFSGTWTSGREIEQ